MTPGDDTGRILLRVLAASPRGPGRQAAFAVWLVVRVAQDLISGAGPAERAHRRRVQALERRLSSLTLPPSLRRALGSILPLLRTATASDARLALIQLVAPVRDTLGNVAAEAVHHAALAAPSS